MDGGVSSDEDRDRTINQETASSPTGRLSLWPKAGVSRSFVHKKMTRESLGPRFPDSERRELRARASFLIDGSTLDTSERSKFQELEKLSQSPTVAAKRFSKTPREAFAAEEHQVEGGKTKKVGTSDSHEIRETNTDESRDSDNESPSKKSLFRAVFLSKQRNRR